MKKWVKALRSGEYVKGKYYLCTEDIQGNCQFCALGVLVELYIQEQNDITKHGWYFSPESLRDIRGLRPLSYNKTRVALPRSVMLWAGMKTEQGYIESMTTAIANINDWYGYKFNDIADTIEAHYKEI